MRDADIVQAIRSLREQIARLSAGAPLRISNPVVFSDHVRNWIKLCKITVDSAGNTFSIAEQGSGATWTQDDVEVWEAKALTFSLGKV